MSEPVSNYIRTPIILLDLVGVGGTLFSHVLIPSEKDEYLQTPSQLQVHLPRLSQVHTYQIANLISVARTDTVRVDKEPALPNAPTKDR